MRYPNAVFRVEGKNNLETRISQIVRVKSWDLPFVLQYKIINRKEIQYTILFDPKIPNYFLII